MATIKIKMKSVVKLLLLSVVWLTILTADGYSQTRWKLAGFDSRPKPFYVDENLQRQPDGNIIGWQKTELPSNNIHPVGAYFVIKTEWNCDNRMSRDLQFFIYNQAGEFIERTESEANWKSNPPESIGEIVLENVCRTLQKKRTITAKVPSSVNSLAQIIVRRADLMSEANGESEVIRRVGLNEKLVLVSDESVGVWYRVADSKTNSQGWLHGNDFKIVKAKKRLNSTRKKVRRR